MLAPDYAVSSSSFESAHREKTHSNRPSAIRSAITSSIRRRLTSSTSSMSLDQKYRPERHSPVMRFLAVSEAIFAYEKNDATHRVPSAKVTIASELPSAGVHSPGGPSSPPVHTVYSR